MNDEDRCRCGHHRAHHLNVCKAMRPVGVGSTPPGFRQRTERCPCLGFTLWRTAEQAEDEADGRAVRAVLNDPTETYTPAREAFDTLDDAGSIGAATAAFLLCLIAIGLFLLAVIGGQHAMCRIDPQGHSYCSAWQQAHR